MANKRKETAQRLQEIESIRARELCVKTQPLPAWMVDPRELPKRPPTRDGRP